MDRPKSSKYGNPITFNVATMFLFYVLSVTLCLSSFSTCVCVIFDPVGTFRTITNYFLYALGLGILLTFLFVGLTGVCFDEQAPPESQGISEIVDEMPVPAEHHKVPASQEAVDAAPVQEPHHEVSAPQEIVDSAPIQEEHLEVSAPQEVEEATLIQEEHLEVSAPQEVQEATLTPDAFREASAPQFPVDATTIHATPTPLLTTTDTAKIDNAAPRFCGETSASLEEMNHAAEGKEQAPKATTTTSHTETVMTARESKKIEKWLSQTNSADTHATTASCSALEGGDALDEDTNEETAATIVWVRNDGGPLSETQSVSRDSDFQKALRVYMDKGPRYAGRQGESGSSTPSSGSSEESEFQGLVRKRFTLEKVGEKKAEGKKAEGKRKARSV
ncbi:MAG: hypothetical protein Q9161_008888 [Pseudevernia consocians]